ncbi:hypothetical protein GQ43DRAFT_470368 [Delitschia confertaspora ATCC 74209]|uniref:Uncharacterized protein n=1 Tax=Delitschia confertaspora ATCC 74209 TaxID=1513339 RepID=A0A9P4JP58_9PLEO|nr:hypothetical protein GQ43DRAFT_470368 [Delitschia confertaspora ATCC 74209]
MPRGIASNADLEIRRIAPIAGTGAATEHLQLGMSERQWRLRLKVRNVQRMPERMSMGRIPSVHGRAGWNNLGYYPSKAQWGWQKLCALAVEEEYQYCASAPIQYGLPQYKENLFEALSISERGQAYQEKNSIILDDKRASECYICTNPYGNHGNNVSKKRDDLMWVKRCLATLAGALSALHANYISTPSASAASIGLHPRLKEIVDAFFPFGNDTPSNGVSRTVIAGIVYTVCMMCLYQANWRDRFQDHFLMAGIVCGVLVGLCTHMDLLHMVLAILSCAILGALSVSGVVHWAFRKWCW